MGAFEDSNKIIGRGKKSNQRGHYIEFFIQQLNSTHYPCLLALMIAFISSKDFLGEPVQCFCPATFTDSQVDYTNNYCFLGNTYYVPLDKLIGEPEVRRARLITYYPWVTVIFLCHAMMFVVPKWIWWALCASSDLDLRCILKPLGNKDENIIKAKELSNVAFSIDLWIKNLILMSKIGHSYDGHYIGKRRYLASSYVFCNFLYLCNSIGQVFLLDLLLANNYKMYGFDLLFGESDRHVVDGRSRFPVSTLCDTEIRQMNNIVTYTIQCALPHNFFNNKAFLILWFALVTLSVLNVLSLLDNIAIFLPRRRQSIMRKLLIEERNQKTADEEEIFNEFIDDYLDVDGVFVLSVLDYHGGCIPTSFLADYLWKNFREQRKHAEVVKKYT